MLLNLVPVYSYLQAKSTNTDALPTATIPPAMAPLEAPTLTEMEDLSVPVLGVVSTVSTETSQASAPVISPCASTPTPSTDQISVCGRVIPLDYNNFYAQVSPTPGRAVKYNYRNFIFGHNSYDVFGGLHALLQPGDPIIVNFGGSQETYYFSYFRLNESQLDVDDEFKPKNGSSVLALMTCAPWVTDGTADLSRYGFIFTK